MTVSGRRDPALYAPTDITGRTGLRTSDGLELSLTSNGGAA